MKIMNNYFIKPTKDFCYKVLINPRSVYRNRVSMYKALESLNETHKPITVITKSDNIILKTEEEIINYFLKRIKPNENK